ncbi:MAG: glycoside hydrolase family 36 protein [Promethearchaeota archaeon]
MHECVIKSQNKEIFELTNGLVSVIFHKIGEKQGLFTIKFYNDTAILEDCYSAINFSDPDKKILTEVASYEYCFSENTELIEDDIGRGIKAIFSTLCVANQMTFFKIQIKMYDEKDFILLKIIEIEDHSPNPLPVHSIAPIVIKDQPIWLAGKESPINLNKISWFKNGWQSWSPCYILFGKEKDKYRAPIKMIRRVLDNQDYKIKGRFYSDYCTVLTDLESKNSLIMGFVSLKDQFTRLILDYKKKNKVKLLTAFGCMDDITFTESSINYSEELFISFKTNNLGYYGLIDYARIVNALITEERITDIPTGWCSWYYYYTKITQDDVIKNLKFFKEKQNEVPIDFIQLDDGYQKAIGDFNLVNEKFNKGLPWLFKKIKDAGFKGGIWTAPFFAVKNSELFHLHKDWFLKKIKSKKYIKATFNWGAFLYPLDLTKNEVLDYIREFFKSLSYAFDENKKEKLINFFKIDFLHAAVPYDGDYYNKKLTRAQLFRKGIEAIREGIGEESFLLGCGAPLGPCIGLVDAMRIGTDTAPYWSIFEKLLEKKGISPPALKRALLQTIYRSFMHQYFWINDPDCLMIRRTNTKLNLDEIKLQITIFGISGGQLLISDDMSLLTEDEINDALLVIPPYNPEDNDPIPPDVFISKFPSYYIRETLEDIGKRYLIAIINWDDKIITKHIKISEIIPNLEVDEELFLIWDFWNKCFIGKYKSEKNIDLGVINPHSCLYISAIPFTEDFNNEPILLATDLHISQGCSEITEFNYDDEENTINIIIDLPGKRKGNLYIMLPKNKKISDSEENISLYDEKNNIWKIYIEFQDNYSLDLIIKD